MTCRIQSSRKGCDRCDCRTAIITSPGKKTVVTIGPRPSYFRLLIKGIAIQVMPWIALYLILRCI
jgi:hypothetical protein